MVRSRLMVSGIWLLAASASALGATTQLPPPGEYVPDRVIVAFKVPPEAREGKRTIDELEAAGVAAVRPLAEKVRTDFAAAVTNMEPLLKEVPPPVARPKPMPKLAENSLKYVYIYDLQPGTDLLATIQAMEVRPDVAYAEVDGIVRASLTPNDPYYSYLYGLDKIKAPDVWNVTTGNTAIRVAVIDTGIDYNHPDLSGPRFINGFDYVNNDGDSTDDHYHGTHVAGTVGATINNAIGVAGVAQCEIIGVKVLSASGSGTNQQVANGISYAWNQGAADVLNLSLGSSISSGLIQTAVNDAHTAGRLVICAAGNSNTAAPFYPAAYSNSFSVVATTDADQRAGFSNFGPTVDISAPGVYILSAIPVSLGSYYYLSGTSMAAPHVAGSAALMWGTNPGMTAAQVRSLLENNADDLGAPGRDDQFGFGRINLQRCRTALATMPSITTPPTLPQATIATGYGPVSLTAAGGFAPLTWSTVPLRQSTLATTALTTGTYRDYRADEQVWQVQMPFAFPYGGQTYTRFWVSSNGFIDFATAQPSAQYNNSTSGLGARVRIAPLWDDLSTDGIINIPEDIYTAQPTGDSFMVRWQGHSFGLDQPVNFGCVLLLDGRIRFDYGAGNTLLTPTVGLGFGNGQTMLPTGYDGANTLTNSGSVQFTPGSLPSGMTLSSSGTIAGTPVQGGQFNVRARATDAIGQGVEKDFQLFVDDPAVQPPRIISIQPLPGNQIFSSKQPDVLDFDIVFREDVVIAVSDITVVGTSTGAQPFNVSYDSSTRTATLLIAGPLQEDTYTFTINDTVEDLKGRNLDGEIVGNLLPSGDLVEGGDAVWTFKVSPWWDELQLNTYTAAAGGTAQSAFAADRSFVSVWSSSGLDGSGFGIIGQRFSDGGLKIGPEIAIPNITAGEQYAYSLGMTPDGGFVTTWHSDGVDGSGHGVRARRFDANGVALGTEFAVNTYTSDYQDYAHIAVHSDGSFVITWQSVGQDGSSLGVYMRRFDSNGIPLDAGDVQVPNTTSGAQKHPYIAMADDGRYIIVWASTDGIWARRFQTNGVAMGSEFQVSATTFLTTINPSVACGTDFSFVVCWEADGQDGSANAVLARTYDAGGLPLGGQFLVNTYTSNDQGAPKVAVAEDGTFVIIWRSLGQHGSGYGTFGQRYTSSGVPLGGEFRVNQLTPDDPYIISLSIPPNSGRDFFVSYVGAQDGDPTGVFFARYFDAEPPTITTVTPAPDSVIGSTSTNTISIEFSDDVVVCPSKITVQDDFGFAHNDFTLAYNENTYTASLTYAQPLPSGRAYVMTVDDGVYRKDPRYDYSLPFFDDFNAGPSPLWRNERGNWTTSGGWYYAQAPTNNPWTITTLPFIVRDFTIDVDIIDVHNSGIYLRRTADGNRAVILEFVAPEAGTLKWWKVTDSGSMLHTSVPGVVSVGDDPHVRITASGDTFSVYLNGSATPTSTVTIPGYGPGHVGLYDATTGDFFDNFVLDGPMVCPEFMIPFDDFQVFLDGEWEHTSGPSGDGVEGGDAMWCFTIGRDAPWSGESRINQTITGLQLHPVAAGLRDDLFVAAWDSTTADGSVTGIMAATFNSFGYRLGCEFPVNTTTAGNQNKAAIAAFRDGNFVVAWTGNGPGDADGIFIRKFDADGFALTDEILVNTVTANDQSEAAVAISDDGQIVVAWQSLGEKASGYGIFGRLMGEDLTFNGNVFQVNLATTGDQVNPDVEWLSNGRFVVTWQAPDGVSTGIFAQAYDAEGFKVGDPDVPVNANILGTQRNSRVARLEGGGVVVVWEDNQIEGNGYGIVARPFDADLVGGTAYVVNNVTTGDSTNPDVSALSSGDLVVTWQGTAQTPPGDPSDTGIYQRRLQSDGLAPLGTESLMNVYLPGFQERPSIGALSDGDFFVVWDGEGPFSDVDGVYGRWFDATPPTVLNVTVLTDTRGAMTEETIFTLGEGQPFRGLIPPPTGLRLQFSEKVNVNPVTISVVGDTVGTRPFVGDFDDHAWQLTMMFDDPLPMDDYTLTVPFTGATSVTNSALDGNGDALAGDDFVFQFAPCTEVPYGDLNITGVVDVDDILYMLDGFTDPESFPNADIEPCGAGDVDVDDILAILDAFSGNPLCEDPCV